MVPKTVANEPETVAMETEINDAPLSNPPSGSFLAFWQALDTNVRNGTLDLDYELDLTQELATLFSNAFYEMQFENVKWAIWKISTYDTFVYDIEQKMIRQSEAYVNANMAADSDVVMILFKKWLWRFQSAKKNVGKKSYKRKISDAVANDIIKEDLQSKLEWYWERRLETCLQFALEEKGAVVQVDDRDGQKLALSCIVDFILA